MYKMYQLGKTSKQRLSTCHEDLQLIFNESIKVSTVDFGIAQGERSIEQQQEYFDNEKSKINPKNYSSLIELYKKAKHLVDGKIRKKSDAVDVYAYYNGLAQWDLESLCYIAGVVTATANRLLKEKKISHKIRWGGNWDQDGVILIDQSFIDGPHYELVR
jgi:peptidoglycan L-alanyl-D-glutamate endopeptidase CwlK